MTKFKVGDRVKGNTGYSFDPIEGIIIEKRGEGLYRIEITKTHNQAYLNEGGLWAYSTKNLKLIKEKPITNWKGELE